MNTQLMVLLVIVVCVAVIAALARSKRGALGADIYRRQEQLFSAAELRFLAALDQAIAPGHRVLGKIRLADLAAPRPGLSPKIRQIALNRIAQKHVDFVICSGASLVPICAIELNDSSHNSGATKRRDELVSAVFSQIGIPLVVVKAAGSYSPETLRQQIVGSIQVQEK